ncbi:MAG: type I methionyl aminopeptidase, partial [Gemmatimonadetes bacterium]|nr:type I methionyl aminopeptidase [Gemmatimonadota bacterium]NIU76552.1 type I methionyl aminopeptidase [Gammaproteobacteria bacterium]NIQ56359.1 type I methionyl aminopeptidase [Gemmatimonadota bacterium]NIW35265.1 type I methionyl aminopeptidase [Gemmatimonadota bacterium]NIX46005.1 type I methionyl aminopeptidase [Gemmatimonadota bacterium]
MTMLKTAADIEAIARAGTIIAALFDALDDRVGPGVSTADLDALAEDFIRSHDGAEPAFKGLYG